MPAPIPRCCSWRASSASGPRRGKEVILATQRALEQQALERWKLQKEAQIEQMMRDGVPLGAVAAALASPETAERIAVLEAATSGGLSALDAARLNVRRAGHDLALLDGLDGVRGSASRATRRTRRGGSRSASPLSQLDSLPLAPLATSERSAVVTVALTEGLPEARGRTWTAEDYAKRDAAMARWASAPSCRSGRTRSQVANGTA